MARHTDDVIIFKDVDLGHMKSDLQSLYIL